LFVEAYVSEKRRAADTAH